MPILLADTLVQSSDHIIEEDEGELCDTSKSEDEEENEEANLEDSDAEEQEYDSEQEYYMAMREDEEIERAREAHGA